MAKGKRKINPLLQFMSWLDWSPYAEDADGALPLWFNVQAVSSIAGQGRAKTRHVSDSIHFGTRESFTKRRKTYFDNALTAGKTRRLQFRLDTSYSDMRDGDGWQDDEDDCSIEFSTDAHSRLSAVVHFDNPTPWIDFAKQLFVTRLKAAQNLKHHDLRLWQLVSMVSPELRKAVVVELRKPLEEFLHVELELILAGRGLYLSVIPNRIMDRSKIIRALLKPDSVFTKNQIGIIFPYDTKGQGFETDLAPARYETVQSMIEAAHVQPIFEGRFCTSQIVEQLLPTACNQPKAQTRYFDIRDELRTLGIYVPDQPIVQTDS